MYRFLQLNHPALARCGAVTLAATVWLSLFCSQCPAAELPGTDTMPAGHCRSGMLQQDTGRHGDHCGKPCDSHLVALQMPVSMAAVSTCNPVPDPVTAVMPQDTRTVALRAQPPVPFYAGPERSTLPLFRRYTVLLN